MSFCNFPIAALAAIVGLASACADPVRSDELDALGPEAAGVPPGPLHRAGQRCVGPCHDGEGPGAWLFSMGGTVYEYADKKTPLAGAIVHVVDSAGNTYRTATNCVGNFFIQAVDFTPQYPAWTWVEYAGISNSMHSAIWREGSCAGCHTNPPGRTSAGRVYFAPDTYVFPKQPSCQ